MWGLIQGLSLPCVQEAALSSYHPLLVSNSSVGERNVPPCLLPKSPQDTILGPETGLGVKPWFWLCPKWGTGVNLDKWVTGPQFPL